MRPFRPARRARRAGAVVLLAFMLAGCMSGTDPVDSSTNPAAGPDSESTPTQPGRPTAVEPVLRNGQITSAERYLRGNAGAYQWRSFDPVSETGLFVGGSDRHRDYTLDGLGVVGRTGPVATLTCARDLMCPPEDDWLSYTATLGPGADEVTVESADRILRVVGYDGAVRRTLDLIATHDFRGDVRKLAWSPDGSRLAIATDADIWLVEGAGDPQLASSPGRIWSLGGWSPDGRSLLVDRYVGEIGADVVVLHLASDGSPTMTEQTLYRSNRHFDWAGNSAWSPDGTRIAVRTDDSIVEISAEDGNVLDRHQHISGWLIWPRRDR